MQFFIPGLCPVCKSEGKKIRYENILSNLRSIKGLDEAKEYYYCKNPACEVVYFSGLQQWRNSELIRPTAAKSNDPQATVCYCFDYRIKDISQEAFEEYQAKKSRGCACGVRNPSGKCCSKLFRSFL